MVTKQVAKSGRMRKPGQFGASSGSSTPASPTSPATAMLNTLPADTKVLIYSAGQSNWEGAGPDAYDGTWPSKAMSWDKSKQIFERITPTSGFRTQANATLYMLERLEANYPDLIFHVGEQGTGNTGFAQGEWAPGGSQRTPYIQMIENSYAAAKGDGNDFYLLGAIFNQGEQDAYEQTAADEYGNRLQSLITEANSKTAEKLNWINTRLNDSIDSSYWLKDTIRSHQETVGDGYVDIDEAVMHTDNLHYGAAGYKTIGIKQADKLATFNAYKIAP